MIAAIEIVPRQARRPQPPQPAPITEVDFLPDLPQGHRELRRSRPDRQVGHEVLHRLHVRRRRAPFSPTSSRASASITCRFAAISIRSFPASIPSPSSRTSARWAKRWWPTTATPASAPTATPTASAPPTSTATSSIRTRSISVLLSWVLQAQGLARRRHPRLQHHQDARPHLRRSTAAS